MSRAVADTIDTAWARRAREGRDLSARDNGAAPQAPTALEGSHRELCCALEDSYG
ncbi:hypothetical protein GCM10007198_22850 [Microbacterium aerolatum]|uniref:Uncharacterized protein n=1 Tax=Microbacterium aerolatum TaxID=153731 RepID=A0A511ABH3_9MICO|nr:hypothetical protein MAE01_07040 [Microbacterium aerolatum]GGB31772.1 hypothetical protein GCM10007198_22850 [Microbacterium aerolatum]